MRIVLVGKKYILKRELSKNIDGNYYIIDKNQKIEKKLININYNNGKWEIISNNYQKILNKEYLKTNKSNLKKDEIIIERVTLEENKVYPIFLEQLRESFILYCFPDYQDDMYHLDIEGIQEFTIGFNDKNNIVCKNEFVADTHIKFTKFKGKWNIKNYDSQYGVFVNNYPVYNNEKNIFNGDVIFIMGLQIIMIKDSLYINNIQNNLVFDNKYFVPSKVKNAELINADNKESEITDLENEKEQVIDYYSRAPKMIPEIKKENIKIDEPPQVAENQQKPAILMMGSSIAMGVMMMASMLTTIQGIVRGTASVAETIVGIITSLAMLIAMLVIPVLDVKWDKRSKRKYEQKRQEKYMKYLKKKRDSINEIKKRQKQILFKNYLSGNECAEVIFRNSPRLWERSISEEDFLSIRLGLGTAQLKADITYPEEKFSMNDDKLLDELNDVVNSARTINYAPLIISLVKKKILAVISKEEEILNKYLKNLILQLVTFHSYQDLKLVFLVNKKRAKNWEYVKMLPHIWNNSIQLRFFADNYDDMNEISKYLEEEIKLRSQKENLEKNYKDFSPYYLIITDDYRRIENLPFIEDFLKDKKNLGFSLLCVSDDVINLPNSCETFINIASKTKGELFENAIDITNKTEITLEPLSAFFFEKISRKLANIQMRDKEEGAHSLPSSYSFLEMYDVGNIEQLDIKQRWSKNDSTLSLKAPIGINSNGNIISLDIHEKAHGPHGLIAGSTGSGKSEFIITYILSLAINYHPNDVTFLLIDYKGGGLAGAFQKNNIKLPHLVGTITNIDQNGLQRSLTSIQSELRRRQAIFNEARNMTDEGTIDIYKYQKLYHDGVVSRPIPHLFIICDEFAELKQQQIEFMDELMSVSRIGRSLGVHLILATQKPAGIVDDQIRSNSKFGICLKVQDKSDSLDVILRPDAAYLKRPGQFYLKVGQDEYFILGQSGWAGAPYIPSKFPKKNIDNSVEFISNIGLPIKRMDDAKQKIKENKEQLTSILKYIYNLSIEENIQTNNLWLDNIPKDIFVSKLRDKYNIKTKKNNISVVVGEYDDPSNQKQGLVQFELTKRDNIIIYGNAESGKETLLSTMIYDLMTTYSTEEAQLYILDFGTEALKIFKKSPHIGDLIFLGQDEKLEVFFEMIQANIKERKQILSNYNGDYNLYISKGNIMPITVIMINNYEAFNENYEDKYDDLILTLTREGPKCGILFVLTASSTASMRYRMAANFNKKIALQMNNEDDYHSVFDNVAKKRPAHIFGRGLVAINKEILEFQTAKICETIEFNEHIQEKIEEIKQKNPVKAMPVPTMPKKIEIDDVKPYLKGLSKVPIGMTKKNLDVYTYDFIKNFMTVIAAKNMADSLEFTQYIIEEIKSLENVKVNILDAQEIKSNEEYNEFINEMEKEQKENSNLHTLCVIIGIGKMINEGIINGLEFDEFLNNVKENQKYSFIMVEKPDRLEEYTYEAWYTDHINKDCGIWVGNGIENQTLITTNFSMEGLENNCGNSFGYVINEGISTLIKCIGIIEEGDDDE